VREGRPAKNFASDQRSRNLVADQRSRSYNHHNHQCLLSKVQQDPQWQKMSQQRSLGKQKSHDRESLWEQTAGKLATDQRSRRRRVKAQLLKVLQKSQCPVVESVATDQES
jgi:hypothetical protein